MNITNLDEFVNHVIPKSKAKNINDFAPKWPFRMCITGSSGSGKSNLLLNMILKHYIYYDDIFMYVKDPTEDKYETLIKYFAGIEEEIEKKCGQKVTIFTIKSNLDEIVPYDQLNKLYQHLIIFDDYNCDKTQEEIVKYFTISRKRNASVIYLAQNLFKTPKLVRDNCNYFAFFKTSSRREILEIYKSFGCDMDKQTFIHLFVEATKDHNFFLIDCVSECIAEKYRMNFDNYYCPL